MKTATKTNITAKELIDLAPKRIYEDIDLGRVQQDLFAHLLARYRQQNKNMPWNCKVVGSTFPLPQAHFQALLYLRLRNPMRTSPS